MTNYQKRPVYVPPTTPEEVQQREDELRSVGVVPIPLTPSSTAVVEIWRYRQNHVKK